MLTAVLLLINAPIHQSICPFILYCCTGCEACHRHGTLWLWWSRRCHCLPTQGSNFFRNQYGPELDRTYPRYLPHFRQVSDNANMHASSAYSCGSAGPRSSSLGTRTPIGLMLRNPESTSVSHAQIFPRTLVIVNE